MDRNHSSKNSLGPKSYSNYLLNPNHDPLLSSASLVSSSQDDYIPKPSTENEQFLLDGEAKLWPTLPLFDLFINLSSSPMDSVESNWLTNSLEEVSDHGCDNLPEKAISDGESIDDIDASDDSESQDDDDDDNEDDVHEDEDNRDEKENYTPNKDNVEVKQTLITIVSNVPLIANIDKMMVTTPSIPTTINGQKVASPATCCRKHEKFYHKLLAKKSDRPVNTRRLIVNDLYVPMDNRSYLKPKFSHNMLCAFAIVSGSDSDFKIEVADIYRFLGKCFPYFETAELHWRNSLRHSLATCNWFVKSEVHRTAKKGYKWTINNQHLSCLRWEIKKQCIKDVTRLYHCLAGPEVCHHLITMGLLEVDLPTLTLLRESFNL